MRAFGPHGCRFVGSLQPDGELLAMASAGGTVKLWNARTCQELAVLFGHADPVYGVAFSPEGELLALGARTPPCAFGRPCVGRKGRCSLAMRAG